MPRSIEEVSMIGKFREKIKKSYGIVKNDIKGGVSQAKSSARASINQMSENLQKNKRDPQKWRKAGMDFQGFLRGR